MKSRLNGSNRFFLCLQLIFFLALTMGSLSADGADGEKGDIGVDLLRFEYGYWAPEIRELHLRVELKADPVDGDGAFKPQGVLVNGEKPLYAYWYFDGVSFDYRAVANAHEKKIEVFIPLAWRGGGTNSIVLLYKRGEDAGRLAFEAAAPKKGGVWKKSAGGNRIFKVCEMANLARQNEPVEFDVTIQEVVFQRPDRNLRATLMTDSGVYREIPCQVYDYERLTGKSRYGSAPVVHFKAAVQLSLKPRSEAVVVLWNCPDDAAPESPPGVTMKVAESGTTIDNEFYRVDLCPKSGQMFSWFDKKRSVNFNYDDPRGHPPAIRPINRTPGIYAEGRHWSHAFDWESHEYQMRSISGPVLCETIRWGPMHDVPEASARVLYRFYANRPEVHIESVIRVTEDCRAYALRNHGMAFSPDMFTHAAWPLQNGEVKSISLQLAQGNDLGAPFLANMPIDTPWIALYHPQKGYDLAFITVKHALFNYLGDHPNMSRARSYVSLYRGLFVYVIRAANITYLGPIRSLPTPLHAGTTLYEKLIVFPFTAGKGESPDFTVISAKHERTLKPLIVIP